MPREAGPDQRAQHRPNRTITVRLAGTTGGTTTASATSIWSSGSTAPPPATRTHPRFSYCYQAVAAGYGPYLRGRDPVYPWYTDRDADGRAYE